MLLGNLFDDLKVQVGLEKLRYGSAAINLALDSLRGEEITSNINKIHIETKKHLVRLRAAGNLLGLLQKDPEAWFKGGASSDDQAEFDAIALRRQEARAAKDWAAADAARDEATAKGIVLEDGPDGTTWRKA